MCCDIAVRRNGFDSPELFPSGTIPQAPEGIGLEFCILISELPRMQNYNLMVHNARTKGILSGRVILSIPLHGRRRTDLGKQQCVRERAFDRLRSGAGRRVRAPAVVATPVLPVTGTGKT